ncbi:hypothetical protein ACIQU6_38190 [Streptomyces sp. NPDC090442]
MAREVSTTVESGRWITFQNCLELLGLVVGEPVRMAGEATGHIPH